jgi:6-pyruvoyltetrahydropterin/6-carboxytetrahydropterin synthase
MRDGKTTDIEPILVRRVYFSSGHRYYNAAWSEAQNREVFGACTHTHGHNYILEAYFQGPVDPQTGMVFNLRSADEILKAVAAHLDHRFLNEEVLHFRETIPTTENIAAYCYRQILQLSPPVQLKKVRLFETEDLWVDYSE